MREKKKLIGDGLITNLIISNESDSLKSAEVRIVSNGPWNLEHIRSFFEKPVKVRLYCILEE